MKEYFRVHESQITPEAERSLIEWLGRPLPNAYLAFLRETNGAEWGVHDTGGDCLNLWPAESIAEYNEGYKIDRWLPGVFAIGSDGGDDAIMFDTTASSDPDSWPVVRVGFGALDREEFCVQAANFQAWAKAEFRLLYELPPPFEALR